MNARKMIEGEITCVRASDSDDEEERNGILRGLTRALELVKFAERHKTERAARNACQKKCKRLIDSGAIWMPRDCQKCGNQDGILNKVRLFRVHADLTRPDVFETLCWPCKSTRNKKEKTT